MKDLDEKQKKGHKKKRFHLKLTTFSVLAIASMVAYHYGFTVPVREHLKEKAVLTLSGISAWNDFVEGDTKALKQIEEAAQAGSGISYLLLSNAYERLAVKEAGVDMDKPGADLSKIDLSRSDQTLRDAMRMSHDFEISMMLNATRDWWDTSGDGEASSIDSNKNSSASINRQRLNQMRSFTNEEKAQFKRCSEKLKPMFSSTTRQLINLRSSGACQEFEES